MWSSCKPKCDGEFEECAQMSKSLSRLMPPAILALLSEESMHGYVLVQKLADTPMFGGVKPDAGGVYRTLKQMEADGHVLSTWNVSESGPAKHTFELTDKGRMCLRRWADTLNCYQRAVNELLAFTCDSLGIKPAPDIDVDAWEDAQPQGAADAASAGEAASASADAG